MSSEQPQQGIGRMLDRVQVLSCWSPVSSVLRPELGHPDDAVHGRANFVAHVRQEVALGAVGGLGRLFRDFQFRFRPSQLLRDLFERLVQSGAGLGVRGPFFGLLAFPFRFARGASSSWAYVF